MARADRNADGTPFAPFDSASPTQTQSQLNGDDVNAPCGTIDPRNVYNQAGKYRAGFGTPFDLAELAGRDPAVDVRSIKYVRVRI